MSLPMLKVVQRENQDFEWYPTTTEIIRILKLDIEKHHRWNRGTSILDCGAGDGRVLMALPYDRKFAIEKSMPLIQSMDPSIVIVGTDFHQQTMIDKQVDVIFCNPPYSEYVQWTEKLIREGNADHLYLVIPQRWKDNPTIENALRLRNAKAHVIGEFDFTAADRPARAEVNLIRVDLRTNRFEEGIIKDPFDVWFDSTFLPPKEEKEADTQKESPTERLRNELLTGDNLVPRLEQLYQRDMQHMLEQYRLLSSLDTEMMKLLGGGIHTLKAGLKEKISGLKNLYWKELFHNLEKITDKLTTKYRRQILEKITGCTHVDFTIPNAYAVVCWVLKHVNLYREEQFVSFTETLVSHANCVLYKSNDKTFKQERWGYRHRATHYKLEHRCVLGNAGGLAKDSWDRNRYSGLKEHAHFYIMDILAIANMLGFPPDTAMDEHQWDDSTSKTFYCTPVRTGKQCELMSIRAFYNGNLHIKFNGEFMQRINVEFGRLKGWVKDWQEAATEMDIPVKTAQENFGALRPVTLDDVPRLGFEI